MDYSVLMSVYYKEKPEYLQQAMQSIFAQTVPTDDFVLVCDGPLTPDLDAVIDAFQDKPNSPLQVVRIKENGGLGKALNVGIRHCKYELIARMDSDDIAHSDRCEKQLAVFERMKVDIVGAAIEEFRSSPDVIEARRIPPETQEEILAFAQKRNPFNHPCVMYRKSAVESVGSYQEFYLLEDYYLWLRMLKAGYRGYNIQEPLLWMRAGSDLYKRRGGWKYAAAQRKLFRYMKDQGMIGYRNYIVSCILRTASACAPSWVREKAFKKVLRK